MRDFSRTCEDRNNKYNTVRADIRVFLLVMSAVVVSALEGKDCREMMRSTAEKSCIPQERLSHIVAGMYRVLTEATRIPTSSLKQEVGYVFSVVEHMHI